MYQIVCDEKGYLRVRYGTYAFDYKGADNLKEFLEEHSFIKSSKVSSLNGSVLLRYKSGFRDEVLSLLDGISPKDYMVDRSKAPEEKIFSLIAGRIIGSLFFPIPLRNLLTIYRSLNYIKEGLSSFSEGRVGVAVLDATGITVALLSGRMVTAANIMTLLSASEILEESVMERTRKELSSSIVIHQDKVWVYEEGEEVLKNFSEVKEGDTLIFRTGKMICVDGEVVYGRASINEQSLSGEPFPVEKDKGKTVFAGSVIEEGEIYVRTHALDRNTRIEQIISLIAEAEANKGETIKYAEILANRMAPLTFALALGVFLLTGNTTKAISVLMVDYSCAIKLYTPIAVLSAMKEASENNMLIKGGKYFEELSRVDTVIFDKTGTLTEANPQLKYVIPFNGYEEEEVLKIAACLEEHFPHSMARAVVDAADKRGIIHEEEHLKVEYIAAHGIKSKLHGERVIIGSRHFVEDDEKVDISEEILKTIEEYEGLSVLYLAKGEEVIGLLFIEDPPREEAKEVIEGLRSSGIENIVMLTGDSKSSAKRVARTLGIDEVRAEVLPNQKYEIVKEFQDRGRKVLMVGDGINDSPALSLANVSISMQDSTDIARESAGITLMSSDLKDILLLREMSQKLLERINLTNNLIFGFNTGFIALGAFGVISPQVSSTLHNFSTFAFAYSGTRPLMKAI